MWKTLCVSLLDSLIKEDMAKGSITIFYFFLIAFSIAPLITWKAGFLILESVQP